MKDRDTVTDCFVCVPLPRKLQVAHAALKDRVSAQVPGLDYRRGDLGRISVLNLRRQPRAHLDVIERN